MSNIYHTSCIPLLGASPISHMGHAWDLGRLLLKQKGPKFVGLSARSNLFLPAIRIDIMQRQWELIPSDDVTIRVVASAGETVRAAYDALPESGFKILNIIVGRDRIDFGNRLKESLVADKIIEMEEHKFDHVNVLSPIEERKHGYSGTKMRQAAFEGDYETFQDHMGMNFKDEYVLFTMKTIEKAIKEGIVPLKRR